MKRIPNNLTFKVLLGDALEYVESQRQIKKRMTSFIHSHKDYAIQSGIYREAPPNHKP